MGFDFIVYLFLFAAATISFTFSVLAGGGGALFLVPIANITLGTAATAPVINLGTFIARPMRLLLFWNHVDWQVVGAYAPAAAISASLSAYFFTKVDVLWLQIGIGIFLISTIFQKRLLKIGISSALWMFYPLGVIVAAIGTIVGATGPVVNPFYMNYALTKEQIIATKTANSFLVGIAQISAYGAFGLLNQKLFFYGLCIGAGAMVGNSSGKWWLGKISEQTFRKILIAFMFGSGLLMLLNGFLQLISA